MQFFSPTLKSTSPTAADKPARLGDKCRTLPIPARLVSRAYPSLCDKCRSVYFSYYIFFGKQLPSEHIASCDKCRSVYYYFAPISRATSVARYLSLRDYVARFPLLCDKCRMLPIFVRQVSHAAYLRATSVARFPLLCDKCRALPIPARLVSRAYHSLCDKRRSIYFSYYIFFGKQLPSEHIASCDKCRSDYYYFAPVSRATSVARFPLLCDNCLALPSFYKEG